MRRKVPTFTLNDNWHHWLFSIGKTKTGVSLTFHKGSLLANPKKALQGEGKYLWTILFGTANEVDSNTIAKLMREAIKHQTDM